MRRSLPGQLSLFGEPEPLAPAGRFAVVFAGPEGATVIDRAVLADPGLVRTTRDHAHAATWPTVAACASWIQSVGFSSAYVACGSEWGTIPAAIVAVEELERHGPFEGLCLECRVIPGKLTDHGQLEDPSAPGVRETEPAGPRKPGAGPVDGPGSDRDGRGAQHVPSDCQGGPGRDEPPLQQLYVHDCGIAGDAVRVTWSEVRFECLDRTGERLPSGRVRFRREGRAIAVRTPPGAFMRDGRLHAPGGQWDAESVLYLAQQGRRGFTLEPSPSRSELPDLDLVEPPALETGTEELPRTAWIGLGQIEHVPAVLPVAREEGARWTSVAINAGDVAVAASEGPAHG